MTREEYDPIWPCLHEDTRKKLHEELKRLKRTPSRHRIHQELGLTKTRLKKLTSHEFFVIALSAKMRHVNVHKGEFVNGDGWEIRFNGVHNPNGMIRFKRENTAWKINIPDLLPINTSRNSIAAHESLSFVRTGPDSDENELIICQWSEPDEKGEFLVAIEPGCILLSVQELSFSDSVCTLKITGSPGGDAMIARAQKQLDLRSRLFDISFTVHEQTGDGYSFPPINRISSVSDHLSKSP